uniref:Olfactory receptor n=1 Tax=Salvator merianae TaxID=96440 RepID=A0A8D0BDB4_SALMN
MANQTFISTFLLLKFSEIQELQILHFLVFLVFYLTTVAENLLIIAAIMLDRHLHTPMYFFIINLAVLDLGTVSTIIPKSMINSLTNYGSISYSGCVAQVFFMFFFASSAFTLLTAMAYDRYVAICNPLQYNRIMHKRSCIQIAAIAWIVSLINTSLQTGGTFAIPFCSNIVHQFFCEIPSLLKLSCSDVNLVEVGLLTFSCCLGIGCFIFIIITYMQILSTVLKIPSTHGQKKALYTCFPHLVVVSLYTSTALFAYARPPSDAFSDMDVVFAVLYTMIPPMLNPLIYSMRNKDIKNALWRLLAFGCFSKTLFGFVL